MRKALKAGNLSHLEQAAIKQFSFFGRKGPFTGFDFLPDPPLTAEELLAKIRQNCIDYPDESLDENNHIH